MIVSIYKRTVMNHQDKVLVHILSLANKYSCNLVICNLILKCQWISDQTNKHISVSFYDILILDWFPSSVTSTEEQPLYRSLYVS